MVKLKRIHGHMMSIGGSFWDLGAGSGKLVIAAAMMHNFEVSSIDHDSKVAHNKSRKLPLVLQSHLIR